jgi:hypothetical protein
MYLSLCNDFRERQTWFFKLATVGLTSLYGVRGMVRRRYVLYRRRTISMMAPGALGGDAGPGEEQRKERIPEP